MRMVKTWLGCKLLCGIIGAASMTVAAAQPDGQAGQKVTPDVAVTTVEAPKEQVMLLNTLLGYASLQANIRKRNIKTSDRYSPTEFSPMANNSRKKLNLKLADGRIKKSTTKVTTKATKTTKTTKTIEQ